VLSTFFKFHFYLKFNHSDFIISNNEISKNCKFIFYSFFLEVSLYYIILTIITGINQTFEKKMKLWLLYGCKMGFKEERKNFK